MNSPTERGIVQNILRFLNEIPGCVARKRWGGGMGVAGDPDIVGCLNGRHLELEVKRPGQQPTVLQSRRLGEWKQAGAVVAVVSSMEEVQRILASEGLLEPVASRNACAENCFSGTWTLFRLFAYISYEGSVRQASARRTLRKIPRQFQSDGTLLKLHPAFR